LPEWVKSIFAEDAYRRLIRQFVSFYRENLFNHHWGEQAGVAPSNTLEIKMLAHGLDTAQVKKVWQPFLDWVGRFSHDYSIDGRVVLASVPARHWWDLAWWKQHWPELGLPNPNNSEFISMVDRALAYVHQQPVFTIDPRPGAAPDNVWWEGDGGQVGWCIWAYQSLWLPESLLASGVQERFAEALFQSSRHAGVSLHFNKGLAGAPPEAIVAARDCSMNPAVTTAFALAITSGGQGPAYPGIPGHEPSVEAGRKAAERVDRCTSQLRALVPSPGAYVSESNYFEKDWQRVYWGENYKRLTAIKNKYDPNGLFYVHHGVGSEQWSTDGFTKL